MRSVLAPQWACLVLLTGLSKTLATPLPEDDLFAAASTGDNIFTSDTQPIDGLGQQEVDFTGGGFQDSYVDGFPQDPLAFGDNSLLGFDPSDPGFDMAAAVDCYYGEPIQPAGSVLATTSCPAERSFVGCDILGTYRPCNTHSRCCTSV